MFCNNCGSKQVQNARFCANCGKANNMQAPPLSISQSAESQQAPQPDIEQSTALPDSKTKETKIWKSVAAIIATLSLLVGGMVIGAMWIFNFGLFGNRPIYTDEPLKQAIKEMPWETVENYETTEGEESGAILEVPGPDPLEGEEEGEGEGESLSVPASIDSFSLTPVYSPNQNPNSHGFFDILITDETSQMLTFEVGNLTSNTITVEINLNTVVTSQIGVIGYVPFLGDPEPDESMLHPFAEIATLGCESEIAIPPNSGVILTAYVEIPREGFDGDILGSIGVMLGMTDEEREEAGMLVNRFQHVVAVRLRGRDLAAATEFVLGDVRSEVSNTNSMVTVNVRNPLPRLVMRTTVSAQIYSTDSDDPRLAAGDWAEDFAPNSFFPLTLNVDHSLYPGEYVVRVQVEHDGTTWELEGELVILEELAEE